LSITMLSYASYRDIKTREISDLLWLIFSAIGLILNIFELYVGTLELSSLLIVMSLCIGFAILTGYLGLFGGADLLAFVVLGFLNPASPLLFSKIIGFVPVIFPITVISNSIFIASTGVIAAFFHNLVTSRDRNLFHGYATFSIWKKIVLFFTGLNKEINSIRGPPFEYPLEKIGENDAISLMLMPNFSDDVEASETLKKLRSMGRLRLWVSYSLPFILILEIGYLSSIVFGDFALWFLSWLIH
jgi:hypothetical protein